MHKKKNVQKKKHKKIFVGILLSISIISFLGGSYKYYIHNKRNKEFIENNVEITGTLVAYETHRYNHYERIMYRVDGEQYFVYKKVSNVPEFDSVHVFLPEELLRRTVYYNPTFPAQAHAGNRPPTKNDVKSGFELGFVISIIGFSILAYYWLLSRVLGGSEPQQQNENNGTQNKNYQVTQEELQHIIDVLNSQQNTPPSGKQ